MNFLENNPTSQLLSGIIMKLSSRALSRPSTSGHTESSICLPPTSPPHFLPTATQGCTQSDRHKALLIALTMSAKQSSHGARRGTKANRETAAAESGVERKIWRRVKQSSCSAYLQECRAGSTSLCAGHLKPEQVRSAGCREVKWVLTVRKKVKMRWAS